VRAATARTVEYGEPGCRVGHVLADGGASVGWCGDPALEPGTGLGSAVFGAPDARDPVSAVRSRQELEPATEALSVPWAAG
jgi:hypothetical protein